ncbi:hypothetical protein TRAPUB_6160 [Trametes pubescens]|uniref:BTB domain-containing protein n=1 Tax=Trametes pubescens TaxID=154538 RepID=A0A1M2V6Q7_TRAPU|nr:hypothetical protein TRAPUB_6160 [Trametes pubescens]
MDDSATSSKEHDYERHHELYFDDGDVVLQVDLESVRRDSNQRERKLFCVHKAVLCAHSIVFSNLFADASASPESTYDGRPLINMGPDNAVDFADLLQYLYDPSRYLLRSSGPDTPLELRGLLTFADKVLCNSVRSALIKRVVLDWPTSLEQWDVRESETQAFTG